MADYLRFIVLLSPVCVLGYSPSYKYLKNHCAPGSTLSFSKDMILEYSRYSTDVPSDSSCQLTIASTDSSRQAQVRFRYLNLPKPFADCRAMGLKLSEGGRPLTPKNGVCGTTRPTTNYRTTGSQVTVELVNHGGPTYADFELLLTTFYRPGQNASCNGGDFLCDNGICISGLLMCNGYNDCGDNSDEVDGCALAVGVIVGIVFGAIIFAVIVTLMCACVVRRRRAYIRVTEDTQDLLLEHLQALTARHQEMQTEQEVWKRAVKDLAKRVERQENHIRRQNLIFFGISRTLTETHEECEAKVREVIRTDMEVTRGISLVRVQRLRSSAVLVRFLTVTDKLLVLSHAHKLRGRQVRVSEDFTKRVRDMRRGLAELKNTYRAQGKRAVLRFDKLYTDFDVFTFDLETRTVRKVTPGLADDHGRYMSLTDPPERAREPSTCSTDSWE